MTTQSDTAPDARYRDAAAPLAERVDDLLARMTLEGRSPSSAASG